MEPLAKSGSFFVFAMKKEKYEQQFEIYGFIKNSLPFVLWGIYFLYGIKDFVQIGSTIQLTGPFKEQAAYEWLIRFFIDDVILLFGIIWLRNYLSKRDEL